jgi:predicted nucleic acid-binding protein
MATSLPSVRKVFFDSSVFYAATYSPRGSARDLLIATIQGRIALVLSAYVIGETERNILKRAPHVHPEFLRLRDNLIYLLSQPADALILDTERVVVEKDAPIIAAARAANTTLVATYDRKHLLSRREEIFAAFGVTVATAGEILAGL